MHERNENKFRSSIGEDLIQMPTTPDDMKLALMDPKLYNMVKDPEQKKFTFELSDAVVSHKPKKKRKTGQVKIVTNPSLIPKPHKQVVKNTYTYYKPPQKSPEVAKIPPKPLSVTAKPKITKPWVQQSRPKLPLTWRFNFQSKFHNMKNALFSTFSARNDEPDLQTLNSNNKVRRIPPKPPVPPPPILPSRRRQRYIPYFTILPRRNMRQKEMYNRRPKRFRTEKPGQPPFSPEPKKDPNADLESFDNFHQDYTLKPDTHSQPPPFTTESYQPKYIPITDVPYDSPEKPQPTQYDPPGPPGHEEEYFAPVYDTEEQEAPPQTPPVYAMNEIPDISSFTLKKVPEYSQPFQPSVDFPGNIPTPTAPRYQVTRPNPVPEIPGSMSYFHLGPNKVSSTEQPNSLPTDRGVKTALFTRVTDVTTSGGDGQEEDEGNNIFDNMWEPKFEHHEEDSIEKAIARHDFELDPDRNWISEGDYFSETSGSPVVYYPNYRKEPYRANTPYNQYPPTTVQRERTRARNYYQDDRSKVRGPQSFLQNQAIPQTYGTPIQNQVDSYGPVLHEDKRHLLPGKRFNLNRQPSYTPSYIPM